MRVNYAGQPHFPNRNDLVSDADRGFASLNYHSAGHRKWRNQIQFVRDRLVKTGQLSNAVQGRWTVTEAGYQRVGMAKPAGVR